MANRVNLEKLRTKLRQYNQEHLIRFWNELTDSERGQLYDDIETVDFPLVTRLFKETLCELNHSNANDKIDDNLIEPLPEQSYESSTDLNDAQLTTYRTLGLTEVSKNNVAVILLAGGQGTRLGVSYPKGMYNINVPSGKSLFQIQAERLLKLQQLAKEYSANSDKEITIPWYIMTSEATKQDTEKYFSDNNYFGLERGNIIIFEQQTLPCFDFNGKILLKSKHQMARSPDGNGGLYRALDRPQLDGNRSILDDMSSRGIEYVHVYCVDNVLVRICDPVFLGYAISRNASAAAKSVVKSHANEPVGVFCRVSNQYRVVEYSEISAQLSQLTDENGHLVYRAGNICNHLFRLDFLKKTANKELKHHVAKKKIPFVDESGHLVCPEMPNGIKLEKFVFDVFEYTEDFVVWNVARDEEFAPLKNNDQATKDTPTTARNALYDLHLRYLRNAGAIIPIDKESSLSPGKALEVPVVEISPLLSYAGENLTDIVHGQVLRPPIVLYGNTEQKRQ